MYFVVACLHYSESFVFLLFFFFLLGAVHCKYAGMWVQKVRTAYGATAVLVALLSFPISGRGTECLTIERKGLCLWQLVSIYFFFCELAMSSSVTRFCHRCRNIKCRWVQLQVAGCWSLQQKGNNHPDIDSSFPTEISTKISITSSQSLNNISK